jgi:hypothetical protein
MQTRTDEVDNPETSSHKNNKTNAHSWVKVIKGLHALPEANRDDDYYYTLASAYYNKALICIENAETIRADRAIVASVDALNNTIALNEKIVNLFQQLYDILRNTYASRQILVDERRKAEGWFEVNVDARFDSTKFDPKDFVLLSQVLRQKTEMDAMTVEMKKQQLDMNYLHEVVFKLAEENNKLQKAWSEKQAALKTELPKHPRLFSERHHRQFSDKKTSEQETSIKQHHHKKSST